MATPGPHDTPTTAAGALLAAAASVLLAEMLVRLAIAPQFAHEGAAGLLVDSTAVVALLLPILYLFVYRPRIAAAERRRVQDAALEAIRDELEARVLDRTNELEAASQLIAASVRQLEEVNGEMAELANLANTLQVCQTLAEAYDVVATSAARLFPGECGDLYMFAAEGAPAESVAHWGAGGTSAGSVDAAHCWALRRGKPHFTDASTPPATWCTHHGDPPAYGAICVPMTAQGETLGVLVLRRPTADSPELPPFSSHQRLASTVADQVSLALANLSMRERLRNQAVRDPLTGLFNRRYLEETLLREVRRAERRGVPLSVVMVDVDHFKRFNDEFGHDAGDVVLREVGRLLGKRVRQEDIACRYGGEEFTLILPDMTPEQALRRADEIRESIGELALVHAEVHLPRVTASLGIAAFPGHGTTPDALLKSADQALYKAKHDGRNRALLAG